MGICLGKRTWCSSRRTEVRANRFATTCRWCVVLVKYTVGQCFIDDAEVDDGASARHGSGCHPAFDKAMFVTGGCASQPYSSFRFSWGARRLDAVPEQIS